MQGHRCLTVGALLFAHWMHSTVAKFTFSDSDALLTAILDGEQFDAASTKSWFETNTPTTTSSQTASEENTSTITWENAIDNQLDASDYTDIPEWTYADPYELYCKPELCLRYNRLGELVAKKHVACGFNESFADDCPAGRKILKIDTELRKLMLHLHNEVRNRLAGGDERGATFAPASRMPTLVWDDELANLAEINVRSCKFEHDECRSTEKFLHAGQNLATGSYYLETDIWEIIRNLTTLWHNEYIDTTQEILDQYTTEYNATVGHYTQMISDRTTAIGCGAVVYPKTKDAFVFKVVLYACNYAITSIVGQPVYLKGESTSRCVTGNNSDYPSLCSTDENVLIKAIPAYD